MGSGIHIKTKENIIKLLEVLRNVQGEIHLRGISKHLGVNPGTISNIIDTYMQDFVETRKVELYGFHAKLIRLKDGKEGSTLNDVLKHYRLRKQIKNR